MRKKKKKLTIESMSRVTTEWMGSPASIIVHTTLFVAVFFLKFLGFELDQIMLILTTAVSLEAIYLSLFIQMTVNRNTKSLEEVEEDLDEIQEDVEAIETSVEDLGEEVDEISADIDEIQEDSEADEAKDKLMTRSAKLQTDINNNMIALMKEVQRLQKEISDLKEAATHRIKE